MEDSGGVNCINSGSFSRVTTDIYGIKKVIVIEDQRPKKRNLEHATTMGQHNSIGLINHCLLFCGRIYG